MVPKSSETNYRHRNELSRSFLLPIILLAAILAQTAQAQVYREWRDTTLPAEKKPYGIGWNDFPVGLYALNYNFDRPLEELWPYMERMNFSLVEIFVEKYGTNPPQNETKWERYRNFLTSSLRPGGGKVIPSVEYAPSVLVQAGQAQEIVFYPFDSSQMKATDYFAPYASENVVTDYNNVVTRFNVASENTETEGVGPRESVYDTGDSGTIVMEGIAYDRKPEQVYRFSKYYDVGTSSWLERSPLTVLDADALMRGKRQPTNLYYIVVTGHLFDGGTSVTGDSLLRINLYYEVPYGENYYDSTDVLQTATANERFHYATLWVKKSDLLPADLLNPVWDEYREVRLPIDLGKCPTCGMGGPLYPGNDSRRFDIEVQYLGKEKLALRSVALRDSIADLLMSDDTPAQNYLQALFDEVDSLITDGSGNLLSQIFALSPVGEPAATNFAGFRETDRLLREHYQNGDGDSLKAWTEWGTPYVQHLGQADWVVPEVYFNSLGGHPQSHCCEEHYDFTSPGMFNIDHMQPPSIKQHNGGRWNIPELFDLDSLGTPTYVATLLERIESYEETMQTSFYGRYTAGEPSWPHNGTRTVHLGREARNARANGKRMLAIIGPNSQFKILKLDTITNRRDTLASHRFEPAELRTLVNLAAFGYGAKGISYYDMALPPWLDNNESVTRENCCLGFGGEAVEDTAREVFDFAFRLPGTQDTVALIHDYFLGLQSTNEEMREMNDWLKNDIGPYLTQLRWRDAYSVEWQARRPGKDGDQTPRPLPSDEIITEVKAWHPITGKVDSGYATYVELGLFETRIDTTGGVRNRLKDTNYVAVVNRRGFETPKEYDISYSSAAKAVMDTLSETRTIRLKLNLHHPIEDSAQYEQYAFVRVREVAPDTAIPLPLIGHRTPLDTLIHADSAFFITLGAGRAGLIEVSYKEPDRSIDVVGNLNFPGQRKFLWDGTRYHLCYERNDTIFYRRSMPLIDSTGINTGSILWHEPVFISDPLITDNRTPSMTFRTLKGDTVVSIVWTRHRDDTTRQVVLRQIAYKNGSYSVDWIEQVAWHYGYNAQQWGTPVVCRLHGADMFAWSDSLSGIRRSARILDTTGTLWWKKQSSATYTNGGAIFPAQGKWQPGQYPSVPPFAHVAGQDSNCAVVWQQPLTAGGEQIWYARLVHSVTPLGQQTTSPINYGQLSPVPGSNFYPSIDQTQDTAHRLQEGVTWSSIEVRKKPVGAGFVPVMMSIVNFRSMWTELAESYAGGGDTIKSTQFWGYARYYADSTTLGFSGYPNANTTWVEQDYVYDPLKDSTVFSVAFNSFSSPAFLKHAAIRYSAESFEWGVSNYAFGGMEPNGSAAPFRIPTRHAVLYRVIDGPSERVQTSRQFFAKERPTGYTATGREVTFRTCQSIDSLQTGVVGMFHDLWKADQDGGTPLHLIERGTTSRLIDSLPQVDDLFRTEYFCASDSTMIGCQFMAWYVGPANGSDSAWVDFVIELCDSASGYGLVQLDSVRIAAATADTISALLTPEFDLLSGTYFIRMRMNVHNLGSDTLGYDSHFPVAEVAEYIAAPPAKLVRRIDREAGSGTRITAQPNPFTKRTEVRFSISRQDYVTVTVYDALGRRSRRWRGENCIKQADTPLSLTDQGCREERI